MVIIILNILLCCTLSAQQATINMTGNDNPTATIGCIKPIICGLFLN